MKQSASKRHGSRARKQRPQPIAWPKKQKRRILPAWLSIATAIGLCAMLVLTINFRAYSDLEKESAQFEELNGRIQQATGENLSLQEEIYYLKNDPDTVEREARKFGLAAPKPEVKQESRADQKPLEREVTKPEPAPTKKEKVSRAGEPDKAEKSATRQLPTRK